MKWDLKKLRHFIEVARARSLSEAARSIGMTQPALTTSIRTLEKQLGFDIFDRDAGFALTALGRELLPLADEALLRISDLEREIELVRSGESGELRVACGPAVADGLVGRAIGRILKDTVALRIEVAVVPVTKFVKLLGRREVDLVVGEPSPFDGRPEFHVARFEPQEVVFFCRADHPLASKRQVEAEDFFSYPHVSTDLPPRLEAWLDQIRPPDAPTRRLAVSCSHFALLQQVVESSDAISGAPRAVVQPGLDAGRLAIVKFRVDPIFNLLGVAHLKTHKPTPLGERLIREIGAVAAES